MNLTTIRGDSEAWQFELLDSAGDPFDLTDCTVTFTIGGLDIVKTLDAGIELDYTPISGEIVVTLDAGDTNDAPDTRATYPYDIQVTTDAGIVKTPARGLVIVIPDVTVD